jgi:hypothetical protein
VKVEGVFDRTFERWLSEELARDLRDERKRLADTLAEILGSVSRQEEIAGRSYWHPNGFAKLVLADDPETGQVRLHVWPDVPNDDDVHGHAWTYESTIVAGELTEIVYQESPGEGLPMWRRSYGQVGHRRFAFGEPTPVRIAEDGGQRVRGVGDVSGGWPGHIHRFFASDAPAVTLLRVGPVVRESSYVYRPTSEPPQVIAPRPTTLDDVREWIGYVATVLED